MTKLKKRKLPEDIDIYELSKVTPIKNRSYATTQIPSLITKLLKIHEHKDDGTYLKYHVKDGKITITLTGEYGDELYE